MNCKIPCLLHLTDGIGRPHATQGILSGYVYTDRPYSGIRKYVHLPPKILYSSRASRKRHANEDDGGSRKVGRKLDDNRFVNDIFLSFFFSFCFVRSTRYRSGIIHTGLSIPIASREPFLLEDDHSDATNILRKSVPVEITMHTIRLNPARGPRARPPHPPISSIKSDPMQPPRYAL